jgi:hypothetical protein
MRRRRLRDSYPRAVAGRSPGAVLEPLGAALPPAERLPSGLADAVELVRREADDAVAHRVSLLGADRVALGRRISWDVDFKSGRRWAPAFYQDVEVTRLDDSSDAKVPWDLSRCHQILALARAAALFGERGYRGELEAQLTAWIEDNPPGRGINWVNPMEVAIRAVNWVWAIGTLDRASMPIGDGVRRRVTESLQVHGRHIAANLEGTPLLRSNHYLADILGLLVLGSCLPGDPASQDWTRLARREFERQIRSQVLPDGFGFEASIPYHGLALEMFVVARHVARLSGRPLTDRFDERLTQMLEASRSIRLPDGRVPQFGDGDSGRILPADSGRPPSHDRQLWLGAAELRLGRPIGGPPDPEVAWTFGVESWQAASAAPAWDQPPASRFPHAGIFVLRGGGTTLVVRCGDVGQNGNGGHAHNDLLSYELFHGKSLVLDSGTYVYTADAQARNAFRSTASHNTVVIDGEEINPFDPRELFRLRQVASPSVHSFEESGDAVRLVASHDGYRRLDCRAVHRRSFEVDRRTGEVSISDAIEGGGQCESASYVHLAPGCVIRAIEENVVEAQHGANAFTIRFGRESVLEAGEGWVSEEYGRRQKAPILVARRRGALPAATGYRFTFQNE